MIAKIKIYLHALHCCIALHWCKKNSLKTILTIHTEEYILQKHNKKFFQMGEEIYELI